ncbi:Glycoside hydrolase superfamily [Acididesulfobacillus acetoxydans]|uniref:Glycoside hydrolase 18 n=1 Tax=Acididesulfobacillus acetoxydans TaxID=1561005 RepID=A0A8S0X4R0_9FIRM|nr:glycosyl hydrolase family 18 protein [Acididesulfobacillus acetoxydans]CAA7601010.1 Glycoside hydrolase superfamily [Acididesulfobacillus acetoxydans]CEJ06884.1 Glycoside hydrolase 18 [Acididesulfobacillus acetoxydans]
MNSSHTALRLREKSLWVLGYAAEDYPGDSRAADSIRSRGSRLDACADFAFFVRDDGYLAGSVNTQILGAAAARDVGYLVLFHNFDGQRFDPRPLQAILSSPPLQRTFIRNVLDSLPAGSAGIQLDFEEVQAGDRLPYVHLLESLQAVLHERGLLLTATLPAKRSEGEAPGYDFAGIGKLCDAVTLMTYDEHYAGGEPGPIAGLPWMIQALDYAINLIPEDKILVGIPVYGYDWSGAPTRMLPMRDIPALVAETKARVLWSDPAVEPYFYYWRGRDRHTVWFENELSAKIRLGFVKSYHLRGIAVWRLGYETKRFWAAVSTKLRH